MLLSALTCSCLFKRCVRRVCVVSNEPVLDMLGDAKLCTCLCTHACMHPLVTCPIHMPSIHAQHTCPTYMPCIHALHAYIHPLYTCPRYMPYVHDLHKCSAYALYTCSTYLLCMHVQHKKTVIVRPLPTMSFSCTTTSNGIPILFANSTSPKRWHGVTWYLTPCKLRQE